MASTRRTSFRLGEETESKLDELAESADSTRTEVVRSLISARHAELHQIEKPRSAEAAPAQMLLDDILTHEVVGYE